MTEVGVGDLAWGKMQGWPPWPCYVLKPDESILNDLSKTYYWVYFFGTHNYAKISKSRLTHYEENRSKYMKPHNSSFIQAVFEADDHLGKKKSNPNYIITVKDNIKIKNRKRKSVSKEQNFKKKVKIKTLTVACERANGLFKNLKPTKPYLERKRSISSSELVYGILGIGTIGRGIAKNLLKSGHTVNVWNRTMSKCDELLEELDGRFLAKIRSFFSPRALLQNSDIVFVCVSNQDVANSIFQLNFGINNPEDLILLNKGIVQMTTTGPEASKDFKAIIEKQGGNYLEAQIQGSKAEALEGNLLILAAGEESLFFDCKSCFQAIGKTAMYLGEVGYASKLNLILQLVKGVKLAALAEGLALTERLGIPQSYILGIFDYYPLASSYLKGKANIIVHKDFTNVEQALKHLQRDMKLGLDLANKEEEPMFLATVANELFKHCKRLEYGQHDASVVYMRSKH